MAAVREEAEFETAYHDGHARQTAPSRLDGSHVTSSPGNPGRFSYAQNHPVAILILVSDS